ncbi:MAG TPA: dTDP-4-dehydrorhamnose reductase [Bacteroidales bacterium]|nr:dTDP-4-dehydrorhamnose reductase [Bacteroidales bacterium]
MNILVTGSQGQLGFELQRIAGTDKLHQWHFTDVAQLDITRRDAVLGYFQAHDIDICLNCAAYTAVDKAEDEPDKAMLINATAVGYLADAALLSKALLIHVSTDYVFDGQHYKPYAEDHHIAPKSAYGHSKAEGERLLMAHQANTIIIRTSWLYSAHGVNFVKTMLKLGLERSELNVVYDQIGTPTWAADLARVIVIFADQYDRKPIKELFHFSNEGVTSWFDFARAIMEHGGRTCQVNPIPSSSWPAKASRPFYSVLAKEKIKSHLGISIPYWKSSLLKCLEELDG